MDRVTWDPEKDRLNQAKHGISFAGGKLVLARVLTLSRCHDLVSGSEARTRIIAV